MAAQRTELAVVGGGDDDVPVERGHRLVRVDARMGVAHPLGHDAERLEWLARGFLLGGLLRRALPATELLAGDMGGTSRTDAADRNLVLISFHPGDEFLQVFRRDVV